jgi:putative ABC transport system permease protein
VRGLGLLQISTQNLRRRLFRTLAVAACFGLITGTLFSESLISGGVQRSLQVGINRLGADLLVVPFGQEIPIQTSLLMGQPTSFTMNRSIQKQIAAIPGVDRTSVQLFIASLQKASCCSGFFQLIAFEPETDFTITPWLKKALNRPLGSDEIIVGSKIFTPVGDELSFFGHKFVVAGRLESTGLGLDGAIFLSIDTAYVMAAESKAKAEQPLEIRPDQISAVLVKVSSDTFPDVVGSRVERTIEGVSVVISAQLVKSVEKQLSTLMDSMMLVTGAFWAASTLLVGTIFSMTTNERRREIGLLRAMGATGTFISKMVLTEATLLTLLGGIFGVIGGGVAMFSFSLLISTALDVPYLWPTLAQVAQMVATSIIVAILTGLLASLFPAIVGGRMEPLNAIRSGE